MKYQTVNERSGGEFLFKLNRYLIEDTPNAMNFIRAQICSLNKRSLKNFSCSIDGELIGFALHFKYVESGMQNSLNRNHQKRRKNVLKIFVISLSVTRQLN